MGRIFNTRETALSEAIAGILTAQPDDYVQIPNLYSFTLHRKHIKENRVQVVTSGGGGYGPQFPGFVGEGLADAVSHGDFDCAPNAYSIYEVSKIIDRGRGVMLITNHFTGDYLNNDMAQELLATDGIDSRVCYASDDRFSARGEAKEKRGGLSGIAMLIKVAAAAADAGLDLEEVFRITEKANDRLRTVTVRVSDDNKTMDFGAGFSGEAPAEVMDFVSADHLAQQAVAFAMDELAQYREGARIHVMINRMAAMSYLEGYVVLTAVKKALEQAGYAVGRCSAGCYFDAFDANGCMISMMAADAELETYLLPVCGYDFSL